MIAVPQMHMPVRNMGRSSASLHGGPSFGCQNEELLS